MSNITAIFDVIDSTLDAMFLPTSKKLVNPYVPEQNDDKSLARGFGFYIGSGVNTNRQLGCFASIRRYVTIINTIVNRGTERDIVIRQTSEKQLLEDQFKLIKELENDPSLSAVVAKMVYLSDNGIEQVYGQDNNYLMIQTTFEMEYLEGV